MSWTTGITRWIWWSHRISSFGKMRQRSNPDSSESKRSWLNSRKNRDMQRPTRKLLRKTWSATSSAWMSLRMKLTSRSSSRALVVSQTSHSQLLNSLMRTLRQHRFALMVSHTIKQMWNQWWFSTNCVVSSKFVQIKLHWNSKNPVTKSLSLNCSNLTYSFDHFNLTESNLAI